MFKHAMKIAWFGILVIHIVLWTTLRREATITGSYEWISWVGVLGFLFWGYLALRLGVFSSKFKKFSRQIIDGNYETGVRPSRIVRDEAASLEALINKIADRLRLFDGLRAEKVAINTRARELVHERSNDPIVLADVDTAAFRFNKAARAFFGVDQETLSFDAIEKRHENAAFVDFFRNTIERDKVPREQRLTVTLPARGASREAVVEIVPIKDREEKVRLALVFLRPAGPIGTDRPAAS